MKMETKELQRCQMEHSVMS